jgi:integrase
LSGREQEANIPAIFKEFKGRVSGMYPAQAPRGDGHTPVDTDRIVGGSKLLGEMRDLIRRKHYSIRNEIERLFVHIEGTPKLVAALLYGAGLRLLEGLRLRIQDLEFERSQIIVRNGKGAKDRVSLLPPALVQLIRDQMASARQLHAQDLVAGLGDVYPLYLGHDRFRARSEQAFARVVGFSRRGRPKKPIGADSTESVMKQARKQQVYARIIAIFWDHHQNVL